MELYALDGEGNSYSNLKWVELENPTTIKEGVFKNGMSKRGMIMFKNPQGLWTCT